MEKEISRRNFLKMGGVALGTFCLGGFLDTPISKGIDKIGNLQTNTKSKKNILDESFKPLENNFSFIGSNFDFFRKIMEIIDPSIVFKFGMKCDFKNNIISIPTGFTYKDIPELINVLKTKLHSNALDIALQNIQNDYMDRAYFLIKSSQYTNHKDLYNEQAYKLFTLSCLYSGIKDENKIQEKFNNLLKNERHNNDIEKDSRKLVISTEASFELKKIKNNEFKISGQERQEFIKLLTKDKGEFVKSFEQKISVYINKLNLKDKAIVKEIIFAQIRTKLKVNEIMKVRIDESFDDIYKSVQEYLKGRNIENIPISEKLEKDINKGIQISLKNDFEKGIYYTMSRDINPILKTKIGNCITSSVDNFEKTNSMSSISYIESLTLFNYIDSHCKESETKEFYELLKKGKKPFPNKELIATLPKKYQSEIIKLQYGMIKTFKSQKFKEVLSDIKSGNYKNVKERIKYLNDDEKINLLYLVFSNIISSIYFGIISTPKYKNNFSTILSASIPNPTIKQTLGINKELINSVLFGGDYLKSKEKEEIYKESNSELKYLKSQKTEINCVTISAMVNYVIEEIFGMEGKGLSVFKQSGKSINHLVNGIKVGDKLLWLDGTNNISFIDDSKKFNKDYYYDTNDFANAYYLGAVDNVGTNEWKKLFSDKFTSYIKSYLDFNDGKAGLSRANRDKINLWKNMQTQKF